MTLPSEIKEGNVAVVFDHGRLGPWEVVIGNDVIYRNNERPESCHRLARHINNALSPLIAQHTALRERAEKLIKAAQDDGGMEWSPEMFELERFLEEAALPGDEGEK